MGSELRVALGAAAGLVGLVAGFVFLIRYVTPSVLGAPVPFAIAAAVAVTLAGVLALTWAAWRLWLWAVRELGRSGQ